MTTLTSSIFDTVPNRDHLHLFQDDKPKYNRIIDFLEFKKEDISKATDVPLNSVRYEENKIPAELRERMREWACLLNLVAEHFQGDAKKTALWFTVTNPLFGNISPRDMIRFGKYKKLFKFVVNALAENRR